VGFVLHEWHRHLRRGYLATTDAEFQDYVIVELLHLRYRSHGRMFKAMMTAMVPEWRERERGSRHVTERRSAD
jgi:predicted metal-dependent hydrolase